jgi:hypothetical protein
MHDYPYRELFYNHAGRQVDKWEHYFAIYDRHLGPHRLRAKRVLEIGVDHGGSLQLWAKFFPHAQIVGVDIRPECAFSYPRIEVVIGDQADMAFMHGLGEFDVVIDDGSHDPSHQLASFEAVWQHTRGVYLIEDCQHGYAIRPIQWLDQIHTFYPWVQVIERPRRLITGNPSRELREDEAQARKDFGI